MKFEIIYHHNVLRKKSRSRRQCDNEKMFDNELFQKMFDEKENNTAKKKQRNRNNACEMIIYFVSNIFVIKMLFN